MKDGQREFYAYIGAVAEDNRRTRQQEDDLEAAFGVPFPRCPICGARRQHALLRHVCVYCGAVEKCTT